MTSSANTVIKPLREITRNGNDVSIKVNLHPGQQRIMRSPAHVIAVFAGTQSGKTELMSHWLKREMVRCGPGDYLLGTSTFKLLNNKLLPDFLYVFKELFNLGEYFSGKGIFEISEEGEQRLWGTTQEVKTRVLIFSGQSPEGAESATAKAAALDEVGQEDFKEQTYEAIERRLIINNGRMLLGTTLYNFGWLKRRVYDPWMRGDKRYDVIQLDSIVNPAFPREAWDRAKRDLPPWKFDLFYRGRYTRPAGMVYDCFDTAIHVIPRIPLSDKWPRYCGHDFGPVNMACIWLALNSDTGEFYLYRTYLANSTKSEGEHIAIWRELMAPGEEKLIVKRVGGMPRNEDGWRSAFTQSGWPILPPKVSKPDQQILKVYELIKKNKFFVFDDQIGFIDELNALSYKLDDLQQPTSKLDNDASSHWMACLRYIASDFRSEAVSFPSNIRPVHGITRSRPERIRY